MNRALLEQSVEGNEGYEVAQYPDSRGLWTFGIGQCVETSPLSPEEWKFLFDGKHLNVQIDRAGAIWLMRRKIDAATNALRSKLPFFDGLPSDAHDVLIEMSFQMGVGGVLKFPAMLKALAAGNMVKAAIEGRDSDWWRDQTRARAERLMKKLEGAT